MGGEAKPQPPSALQEQLGDIREASADAWRSAQFFGKTSAAGTRRTARTSPRVAALAALVALTALLGVYRYWAGGE